MRSLKIAMHSWFIKLEAAEREVSVGDPIPLSPPLFLLTVLKHGDLSMRLEIDDLPFLLFWESNKLRLAFSNLLVRAGLEGNLKSWFEFCFLWLLVSIVANESVWF